MYGPVIEGTKCKLRPMIEKDAHVFVRMLSNPKVTRYLQLQEPPSVRAELDWIEVRATDPNTLSWTIEVEGRCVGSVGFDAIDWRNQTATIGIFIGDTGLWNLGIATEAANLAVRHGFVALPLRKIKAGFLAPNEASGKLQLKLGREVGRWHAEYWRDGQWVDHVLTELNRDEWFAQQLHK